MRHNFWLDRWTEGRIGFHQSDITPSLKLHWADLALDKGSGVFVPLCGKSLDMLWLAKRGHTVVGVELSSIAVEAFFLENGILARRRSTPAFDLFEANEITIFRGDFFDTTGTMLDDVAAIYDRAALISWHPEMRGTYVEHLAAMSRPGTQTLLITLEYPQDQMQGPPFSVRADEVDQLYSRHHVIREISRQDVLATEKRMQSLGVTEVSEVCYHLTRV